MIKDITYMQSSDDQVTELAYKVFKITKLEEKAKYIKHISKNKINHPRTRQ